MKSKVQTISAASQTSPMGARQGERSASAAVSGGSCVIDR